MRLGRPGQPVALQLVANTSQTALTRDIVIEAGSTVFLNGNSTTIITGAHQFQVEDGAKFCMYNINLIDGEVNFVL